MWFKHKIFYRCTAAVSVENSVDLFCNFCFHSKVIPPPEFEPHSKKIRGNKILEPVILQTVSPIRNANCSQISYENETQMTYTKFSKLAEEKEAEFQSLTIDEKEDLFWNSARMHENVTFYALDNPFSLFGDDCKFWNLSKFTNAESLIHQVSNLFIFVVFACDRNQCISVLSCH